MASAKVCKSSPRQEASAAMNGVFTISLDFELHWGGFDKWKLEPSITRVGSQQYFLNTRKAIPEMLKLFAQHDVHVTWAAVGMLLHRTKETLLQDRPESEPSYEEKTYSPYSHIRNFGIGEDEHSDPFHYAHSLAQEILSTKGQELGSHTFGHYYCNERGQTLEQFRADLKAAVRSAARIGSTPKSLVFPRNQFNEEYLRVCYEEGFTSVRSNPRDWFWNIDDVKGESYWKRLNRGADAYLPVGNKNTYSLDSVKAWPGLPLCLPASRLLRPYRPSELFLNRWKIDRVKREMQLAAERGEVYHLWWHPHNFGNYPQESLAGLREILKHFDQCRRTFGMKALSMSETAELLLKQHAEVPAP